MKKWPVQDAKARFSALLEDCLRNGAQIVTKRGTDTAVLVPMSEWLRLNRAAKPSLKCLLLADLPRTDLTLPKRGRLRRRTPRNIV